LTEQIQGFNMESFLEMVEKRKDEIDEQIMDLLLSFVDFESFKEMMLFSRAHLVATTPKLKSSKAAALGLKNTSSAVTKNEEMKDESKPTKMRQDQLKHFEENIDKLTISGKQTRFHKDEQEEGDERPDLNFMLSVSSVKKK
jgi:hypothetical protein